MGNPPNLRKLEEIAKKYNVRLILDGAQSFGAEFMKRKDSLYGDITTTSFFPAKPLGCYGDGGAVFTKDKCLADRVASLRIHGQKQRYIHQYIGIGGRLDSIQAAILRVKLRYFKGDIFLRQKVALGYQEGIKSVDAILPKVLEYRTSTFAQYTIRGEESRSIARKIESRGDSNSGALPIVFAFARMFCFSWA